MTMTATRSKCDALCPVIQSLFALLLAVGSASAASPRVSLVRREAGAVRVSDDGGLASSELDVARYAPGGPLGAKWPPPTRRMPAVCADSIVAETCALLAKSPSPPGTVVAGDLRVAFGCNRDDKIGELIKTVTGQSVPMNSGVSCKALCTGAQAYLQRSAKQFVMPPASDTACAEDMQRRWQCDLEVSPPTVTKLMVQQKLTKKPQTAAAKKNKALPSPKPKKTNKAGKAGKAGAAGKQVIMLSFPEDSSTSALAGPSGDSAAQRISPAALAERYNLSAGSYPYQWYSDDKTQCQYFDTSMANAVVRLAQLFRFYPRINTAYVYSPTTKVNLYNESAVMLLRGLALAEVFSSLTLRDMLYGNTLDEQMRWFAGGGTPQRSQDEVKQIIWRAFSWIGNQLMRGTKVEFTACKAAKADGGAIAWVRANERPQDTIWFPSTWHRSYDKNGFCLINVCYYAAEFPEDFIPIMFIHEMTHLTGPKDNLAPPTQLTQAAQLANAYNYHSFAATVVKETTAAERPQLR